MSARRGVKKEHMPPDLPPQWTVVNSWDVPIDHPGNVIVVSVPSILDPSLAPEARRAGGALEPTRSIERSRAVRARSAAHTTGP